MALTGLLRINKGIGRAGACLMEDETIRSREEITDQIKALHAL